MRAAAPLILALLALAVPASAASPPARVQVVAKEFSLSLSRPSVKAGPAIVELANFGQDAHDLRLQRVGGAKVYGTPIVQPGAIHDLSLRLLPGRYRLWCSLGNHRALGMVATLVVRR
jgi:plastocyanin